MLLPLQDANTFHDNSFHSDSYLSDGYHGDGYHAAPLQATAALTGGGGYTSPQAAPMATAGPGYTAVPSVTMVTAGVSMVTPPAVTGGCYVQSPPPPALHAAYFTNNYSTELPYQV